MPTAPVTEEVVTSPVDVPALRAWVVAHAVDGVETSTSGADGSVLRRPVGESWLEVVLPASGPPVLRSAGPGAAGALEVGRRWLGLDLDPAPGVAALADDPVLGGLVRARPHVRVPGAPDPFAAAVNVVLWQHVSLAAGRVFAGRLAALLPVSPAALAAADPDVLQREVGVTGARARTLVALGAAVAGGLSLEPEADAGLRAVRRAELLALPGVGPWTADLVMMRCLRDPDVFLPGDLVLRKALGGLPAREAARLAEAWAPHRSLAVVHLWTHHALDPR
ncbi:DNA-3-methyladenine glycosylase 2 family protein [Arthrobacter sp. NEB 688]|uniref:DNA-3-methyladenine glycosylase family protein n=1 Tax=Arthrobacter sp. NEB 688 TaxID=904039 RepID=UPI0015676975|nr:DNA-3-methyladenine glycosylase 2 family protein [Arthrobacter sp. NEB 688]QKE85179.1 DNA-3-methyladenine glycosylase 2 family protein [Arthrobacter sp. NEB 688]